MKTFTGLFIILTTAFLLILYSCATTVPPTGGPKDTIPPILIRSNPANNQTNVSGNEIVLEFSETVILKEPKEEIIIIPTPGKDVNYLFRRNIITVQTKKPFEKDVTYSVAFRQAVRDITEGNPAEDLRLAFSTGPHIDSLQLFGSVEILPDATPGAKYTVALFQQDTFNLFKHSPTYFTRADKNGRFTIPNLKPGKYRIYTFEDKNKNLKCDSQSERFGLYPDTVYLPQQRDSLRLSAVKVDCRPLKLNNYRNISDYGLIRLNKNILRYTLTEIKSKIAVPTIASATKAEITYYPRGTSEDSTQVRLTAQDSIGQKLDSTFYIKKTKSKPIKENFRVTLDKVTYTHTTQEWLITGEFSHPIISRPPDSIELYIDTIFYTRAPITKLDYDSLLPRITIFTKYQLKDSLISKPWIAAFPMGTFISLRQDSSKAISKKAIIRTKENMARLIVQSISSEKSLTELVTDTSLPIETQKTKTTNTFINLDPAKIFLRRIQDTNGNGKWDYGNPLNNVPPERIKYYINTEGKKDIPLRANWEVEIDWTKDPIVDKKPKRNKP